MFEPKNLLPPRLLLSLILLAKIWQKRVPLFNVDLQVRASLCAARLSIYVSMYLCIYVSIYPYIYIYIYTCRTYVYACEYIYIYIYICIWLHMCMYAYAFRLSCSQRFCYFWQCAHWNKFLAQFWREIWRFGGKQRRAKMYPTQVHLFCHSCCKITQRQKWQKGWLWTCLVGLPVPNPIFVCSGLLGFVWLRDSRGIVRGNPSAVHSGLERKSLLCISVSSLIWLDRGKLAIGSCRSGIGERQLWRAYTSSMKLTYVNIWFWCVYIYISIQKTFCEKLRQI